ncbi:MAG: redoxin [Burkholderiales bacterium 66-5]|nr:MAG: redoxin [Burkholderiales bacterium 66-5]
MESTLRLGPLALPLAPLLLIFAWIVGSTLHERLARRAGRPAGARHSWLMLLLVLAAARLGYVLNFRSEYGAAPWSMLDICDGGWAPWWGVSAVAAYLLFLWAARSPWRKTASLGAAAALALWLGGMALPQVVPVGAGATQAAQRNGLPEWQATALDGTVVSLPALKGQAVVVNLWATWCPPCRREMPVLREASQQHPQVRFLWVNQGEDQEKTARYAAQQGLPAGNVVLDTGSELSRMLGANGLPTTLFYNAEGTLVARRTGELSAATLAERLALIRR